MNSRVLAVIAIQCLLVTGCSQLEWRKANVSSEEMRADMHGCQQQAHLNAFRYLGPFVSTVPNTSAGPSGTMVIISAPAALQSEQGRQELEFMTTCMRKKGYYLEKATPNDKH